MLPSLHSSHKSIKIFVICGVVDVTSLQFLTKVGIRCPSWRNKALTPTLDALHSTLNVLEKFIRTRSGELINFSLKVTKAFEVHSLIT